jgi:hypothetical protein
MIDQISKRRHINYVRLWQPRVALLGLSILNLLVLIFGSRHVDFRYWSDGFGASVLLIFAAAIMLIDKWWGHLIASVVSAPMVGWFCYVTLKVHDIIPMSSAERELFGDSLSWRQFVIWNHPEILAHNILAALVLGLALVDLSKCLFNQRHSFRNVG